MNEVNLENVLKKISKYNKNEIDKVKKAYMLADKLHEGQYRESGEKYIIHPLNVLNILADMHADGDTLCAGILHDVVEDTDETIEEIEQLFGPVVAKLVSGVTKINNLHFNSKDEATTTNLRRIITSIDTDVRIIIIKLADRLHNMRTLDFKRPEKQIKNAKETLEIYVPIAYYLGAYRMKCELEDLCMKYLYKEDYDNICQMVLKIKNDYQECYEELNREVKEVLSKHNIKFKSRLRVINIYTLLKKLSKKDLTNIHDLVNYKIVVKTIEECYQVLGLIHSLYTPIHYKFKDYIAVPKTNMYASLHTTVFGPNEKLIQIQIKTLKQDNLNTYGITAYWREFKGEAPRKMQYDLKEKFQFFRSLDFLNSIIENNDEYLKKIKTEVFTNNIYVYSLKGQVIELPASATPIDFAYKIHTEIGNKIDKVIINGHEAELDTLLKSKDRVRIITSDIITVQDNWLSIAKTTYAKKKIKEVLNKKVNDFTKK